ncbi:MAG TPA: response regulator [Stellaceae bacterium]
MASSFTVLIVDDDSAARDVLVEVLRDKGLRVFAASHGYEAVRILGDEPVDLLLADIVMPGMDGVQLAAQAKLIRPGIKVLFATGYAQKATERNAVRLGRVLFKPFRRPDLIREVEALLGSAA